MNMLDSKAQLELERMAVGNACIYRFVKICKATMYLMLGVAAMTYANTASATDLAYLANNAGGEIVITDIRGEPCMDVERVAFSRGATGEVIFGCWSFDDHFVTVRWDSGNVRVFRIGDFTLFGNRAHNNPDMRL